MTYKITTYFLLATLILSLSSFASSITTASDSTNIKAHVNNLTAISCDNTAQRCLAVGFMLKKNGDWLYKHSINHVVYATQDGGNTWNEPLTLRHPSNMTIDGTMNIHCDDSGVSCLLVGTATINSNQEDIIVYKTKDAGLHWRGPKRLHIPEDKSSFFEGMSCSNAGDRCLLLAHGSFYGPIIYKTQDAGETWSSLAPLEPENINGYHVRGISCSNSGLQCTIVAGLNIPLSYTTQDGGLTWISTTLHDQLNSDHTKDDYFSNVKCDETGLKCIALRYQNVIKPPIISYLHAYTTLDGGISWRKTSSIYNVDGSIYEHFSNIDSVPVSTFDCDKVGQSCTVAYSLIGVKNASPLIYVTHDGGVTWTNEKINIPEQNTSILLDVFCDDNALLCQIVGMRDPFRNSEKLQKLLSH